MRTLLNSHCIVDIGNKSILRDCEGKLNKTDCRSKFTPLYQSSQLHYKQKNKKNKQKS